MIVAILILTIFNTGLLILLSGVIVAILREDIKKVVSVAIKHTDDSISTAVTAIFNMDSLKQKAEMSDEVEV